MYIHIVHSEYNSELISIDIYQPRSGHFIIQRILLVNMRIFFIIGIVYFYNLLSLFPRRILCFLKILQRSIVSIKDVRYIEFKLEKVSNALGPEKIMLTLNLYINAAHLLSMILNKITLVFFCLEYSNYLGVGTCSLPACCRAFMVMSKTIRNCNS